jgi:hypothetical protein
MLFDPNWTHPDIQLGPVSLKGFIGWLETMPPGAEYDYRMPRTCALGQYQEASGFSGDEVIINLGTSNLTKWQRDLDHIVLTLPWTFGAALSRARALLAAGQQAPDGGSKSRQHASDGA